MPKHLLDLFKTAGVDPMAQQITLMRHKDKRYPLVKYIGTRALNLYQAVQPREMPVGSLLVAFYGNRPGHALLLGTWRVDGMLSAGEALRRGLLEGSFEPLHENWGGYYHDLRELDLLADLRLKLEIEGPEKNWLGGVFCGRRAPNVISGQPTHLLKTFRTEQRQTTPVNYPCRWAVHTASRRDSNRRFRSKDSPVFRL